MGLFTAVSNLMAFRLKGFEIQGCEVWRFSYTLYGKMVWSTYVVLQHRPHHISLKKFYKVRVVITIKSKFWENI